MRRAFTMIELLFVIVVVGIIVAIALPRFDRDNLHEAADQVVSHIRYTQHLAMQDDKFDPNDSQWFKGRWQIQFSTANNTLSYIIYSDTRGGTGVYQGNPTGSTVAGVRVSEVAQNPQNLSTYLIGTNYASFFGDSREVISPKLDLKNTYGIEAVSIQGGGVPAGRVGRAQRRIFFDNMGRPYRGYNNAVNQTNPYQDMNLIQSRLTISLCLKKPCPAGVDEANKIQIAIEPETGYTHIL